jgi:tetratricopeptide (TPR) repeat protein
MAELANIHKQYPEAQALFEECLSKQQIELGLWHPDCLSTMISLAGIYHNYFYSKITYNNHLGTIQSQEKYATAEALYNECLEKKVSLLGKNHPDCLSLMSDVSKTIYSQGRYGESEILYKEILKKRKAVLGKWHSLIQGTLWDLSQAINKQEGRESESEALSMEIMNFNFEGMAWQDPNGYPIH